MRLRPRAVSVMLKTGVALRHLSSVMVKPDLIRRARAKRLYMIDARIVGRFVPGAETIETYELGLNEQQYGRLVSLLKQLAEETGDQNDVCDRDSQ